MTDINDPAGTMTTASQAAAVTEGLNGRGKQAMTGKTIVVWFSCGAASAVAAKKTVEIYGRDNTIRVVNTPVDEEHFDNRRFLKDVTKWLGVDIEIAKNPALKTDSAKDVWHSRRYMGGVNGAPCTTLLKKDARYYWEQQNHHDFMVLGFTYDEKKRHNNFVITERANVLPVLIDLAITKRDCFDIIKAAAIKLPEVYALGYPNANCIGCVKATSPTYWNHVRKTNPEVFADRAAQSRDIGARLVRVKGKRLFLDELDPRAKGKAITAGLGECGIFCEENKP